MAPFFNQKNWFRLQKQGLTLTQKKDIPDHKNKERSLKTKGTWNCMAIVNRNGHCRINSGKAENVVGLVSQFCVDWMGQDVFSEGWLFEKLTLRALLGQTSWWLLWEPCWAKTPTQMPWRVAIVSDNGSNFAVSQICGYRAAHMSNTIVRYCQCSCQVHLFLYYKCIGRTNVICHVILPPCHSLLRCLNDCP